MLIAVRFLLLYFVKQVVQLQWVTVLGDCHRVRAQYGGKHLSWRALQKIALHYSPVATVGSRTTAISQGFWRGRLS